MIKFWILFLALLSVCATATAEPKNPLAPKFEWDAVQINGRPHVKLNKVKAFYQFEALKVDKKQVTLRDKTRILKFTVGEQLADLNGVKFYLSEPIRSLGPETYLSQLDLSTLIDPVLRPENQKTPPAKTVILDPGHGGMDKGSAKLESKYTLALALKIEDALKKKDVKVILTRRQDVFVPLAKRVDIANATPDAILVSLHFNGGSKDAHGFESYILSAREPRKTNAASVMLATAIHSRSLFYLNNRRMGLKPFQTADRGIKRARFNVLSACQHPAVLIEAGFLTHEREAEKIKTEAYQQQLANAIVRGLDVYQNSSQ